MSAWHSKVRPMIEYMCQGHEDTNEDGGQTGAMVEHTVKVAYSAKKMGWQEYIRVITEKQ